MLWLLLVIPPALLAFFWWAGRERQRLLTQFIQARLLPGLTVGISATRQKIRLGCLVAGGGLPDSRAGAAAVGFHWEEVKQRGLDIVVAIDTSKSMLAEDIAPEPPGARQAGRARPDAARQGRPARPGGVRRQRLPAMPADD